MEASIEGSWGVSQSAGVGYVGFANTQGIINLGPIAVAFEVEASHTPVFVGISVISLSISGLGDSDSTGPNPLGGGASGDFEGGVAFSCDTEICCELYYRDYDYNVPDLAPVLDSPLITGLNIYERLKPGATWAATASVAGVGVEIGGTIPTNSDIRVSRSAAVWAQSESISNSYAAITGTTSCSLAIGTDGVGDSGAPNTSASVSATGFGKSGNAAASTSATGVGTSCSVTTSISGVGASTGAIGELTWTQLRAFDLSGVVRAMESSYPDDLTVLLSAGSAAPSSASVSGGSWGVGATQKDYSASSFAGTFDSHSDSDAASEHSFAPVSNMVLTDLDTVEDDTRLGRILLRGWRWSPMSLQHARKTVVDDCSSLTPSDPIAWEGEWDIQDNPTDGGGRPRTLIAVSDGIIEVSRNPAYTGSSAVPVKIRRAFTHDVSLGTYRYLAVRMRSDEESFTPPVLKIGSKAFHGVVCDDDDWYIVEYDLSCEYLPDTESSVADSLWRYPGNVVDGTDYLPETEKTFFGVYRCAAFTLEELDPSTTYEVDNVYLFRKGSTTKVDFLPAFYRGLAQYAGSGGRYIQKVVPDWPQEEFPPRSFGTGGEGTSYYYIRRFLLGNVDGQQGLEVGESRYTYIVPPTSGADSVQFAIASIKTAIDDINLVNDEDTIINPGWEAVDLIPMPTTGCGSYGGSGTGPLRDCLLNSGRPAIELFGGGAYWDGNAWKFRFGAGGGFQQGAVGIGDGATTIPAQLLFDEIEWCSGCGDIFDHGSSDPTNDTLVLKAAAILRGAAHGLIIDDQFKPAQGIDVGLFDPDTFDLYGMGRSGVLGYYRTGGPYAKTQVSYDVQVLGGAFPRPFESETMYARKYQRATFRVLTFCTNLFVPRPDIFFPFTPQFSDPELIPVEEWRRIPGVSRNRDAEAQQGSERELEEAGVGVG